jgi:hypothetical protein
MWAHKCCSRISWFYSLWIGVWRHWELSKVSKLSKEKRLAESLDLDLLDYVTSTPGNNVCYYNFILHIHQFFLWAIWQTVCNFKFNLKHNLKDPSPRIQQAVSLLIILILLIIPNVSIHQFKGNKTNWFSAVVVVRTKPSVEDVYFFTI